MSIEAMKLALFALDIVKIHYTQSRHVNEAITALKERLAQPEQEPVAWMWDVNNGGGYTSKGIGFMQTNIPFAKHTPLYTHPPQRTRPPHKGEHMNKDTQIKGMANPNRGSAGVQEAQPQRTEQNFCPRCGKRTKDMTQIHTCTPPKD